MQHSNRTGVARNWGVFDFCNQVLQSAAELRDASCAVAMSLASENVWLLELRFCPVLHTLEGLTAAAAVDAVVSGLELARKKILKSKPFFAAGVIVCALRSYSEDHGVCMAELAAKKLTPLVATWPKNSLPAIGVVGWDLAGDEGSFPLSRHKAGLLRAQVKVPR